MSRKQGTEKVRSFRTAWRAVRWSEPLFFSVIGSIDAFDFYLNRHIRRVNP
jgi:hypothetical protein